MHTRLLLLWIVLAVSLAVAGLMTWHTAGHFRRVAESPEPVRPWMTLHYVARSQHVPADVVYRAAGVAQHLHRHRSLERIARDQGRPVDNLIGDVRTAIASFRGQPRRPSPQ